MPDLTTKIAEQAVWIEFAEHFKNQDTALAYLKEILECENVCMTDFFQMSSKDVELYYINMRQKEAGGKLSMSTLCKKFWELHSFAAYAADHKEEFGLPRAFEDYFYPWLKKLKQQEKFVHSVPVEDMDALYQAVQEDLMAYTMISLTHRAGLSSNEIAALKPDSLAVYDNGTFAYIEGRETVCYIPEDAAVILERYINERKPVEYLFYNRNGGPLNKMYICRMLKKYTQKAGIPAYSAEKIRTTCGTSMFAYGAGPGQVAKQMGITKTQIQKYHNRQYKDNLLVKANELVKIKVEPPI